MKSETEKSNNSSLNLDPILWFFKKEKKTKHLGLTKWTLFRIL